MKKKGPSPVHPKKLSEMKVSDIMEKNPKIIGPRLTIEGFIERLLSQKEDCFPVVDKDKKLIGIVTESDVIHMLQTPLRQAIVGHALIRHVKKRSADKVGEIMTKRPVVVAPDTSVQETLNLMAAHKLRHIPVVKDSKVVGLVCLRDIIGLYRILR